MIRAFNYPANYIKAVARTLAAEGGFQRSYADRGNWTEGEVGSGNLVGTKFGISAMSYPTLDIFNLTREQAIQIYWEDWWVPCKIANFRPAMQYQVFDAAMNHGMRNASRMVQRAVGAQDDGYIGSMTLAKISKTEINDLLLKFLSERLIFFTNISTFDTYGRGWARRVAHNLSLASEDN